MPHHIWRDDWPHWNELYSAINFIETYWRKYGRIKTYMCKEKWGRFNDYSYFTCVDLKIKFLDKLINAFIFKWQAFIYNRGLQLACIKYPNVVDELLCDLQYYYLVKNGPGTPAGGDELENMYWL